MDFGNLRKKSVRSELIKSCVGLPENAGCILLAVVIMTTTNGMQPTFSGRHTQLFIISDLYRVLTEIAEVNTDIARSVLKFIIPLLP